MNNRRWIQISASLFSGLVALASQSGNSVAGEAGLKQKQKAKPTIDGQSNTEQLAEACDPNLLSNEELQECLKNLGIQYDVDADGRSFCASYKTRKELSRIQGLS